MEKAFSDRGHIVRQNEIFCILLKTFAAKGGNPYKLPKLSDEEIKKLFLKDAKLSEGEFEDFLKFFREKTNHAALKAG